MPVSDDNDLSLWLCLGHIHGLGPQGLCKLLHALGSPEQIFAASQQILRSLTSETIANEILAGPKLAAIEATLEWLAQDNNHLITLGDARYPRALLEIADPPPMLYAKGNLNWLHTPCLAVVGSRNASVQGEKNAEDFAKALCQHGYTIVSGMALGIDGAAHRGALQANGATIAVVGTGLDIVYPARHRELAHAIVQRGLILSEFALGTPSRAQNFPRRNRIISGLSMGCLVIEANLQSGSLITARLAGEQGREVFAIPGSIHSPLSKGCHALIKQGAKLVDHMQDIVEEFADSTYISQSAFMTTAPAEPELNEAQASLMKALGYDPVSMQTLVERSGLTSEHLSAMLLVLELENKVTSLAGGRYQRIA